MSAPSGYVIPKEGPFAALASTVRVMIQQHMQLHQIPSVMLSICVNHKRVYTEGTIKDPKVRYVKPPVRRPFHLRFSGHVVDLSA